MIVFLTLFCLFQKFATDAARSQKSFLKAYDFNRLAAGRVRDYHNNNGVDSLCQLFAKAGAVSSASSESVDEWWGKENNGKLTVLDFVRAIG